MENHFSKYIELCCITLYIENPEALQPGPPGYPPGPDFCTKQKTPRFSSKGFVCGVLPTLYLYEHPNLGHHHPFHAYYT